MKTKISKPLIINVFILLILAITVAPVLSQELDITEVLTAGGQPTGDFIWDIEFDREGKLWACTENGDLFYYTEGEWTTVELPDPGIRDLREMAFTASNELWIVTDGYGILHYNGSEWSQFTTENSDLPSNVFTLIEIDANGIVYAASYFDGVGLCKYDGDEWTQYNESNSNIASDYVNDIAIDGNGTDVWLGQNGFEKPLSRFNGISWNHYNLSEIFGGSYPWVNSIEVDSTGVVWLATDDGVFTYDQGTWTDYRSYSDNRKLYEITLDTSGNIWLYEQFQGLLQYDGENLYEFPGNDTLPNQVFDIIVDSLDFKYIMGNRGSAIIKVQEKDVNTAVYEAPADFSLNIYPQPARDILSIQISPESSVTLYLLDQKRREVAFKEEMCPCKIDLSNLPDGMYILHIEKDKVMIATRNIFKVTRN